MWRTHHDDEGNLYYYNDKGESQYERPSSGVMNPETPSNRRQQRSKLDTNGVLAYGKIEFPTSKKAPAQWIKASGHIADRPAQSEHGPTAGLVAAVMRDPASAIEDDPKGLMSLWNLPKPSVLISIGGSAFLAGNPTSEEEKWQPHMDDKQKLIFRRGLHEVIGNASTCDGDPADPSADMQARAVQSHAPACPQIPVRAPCTVHR